MQIATAAAVCIAALSLPAGALAQFTTHTYDIQRYDLEIRPDFITGALALQTRIQISNPQHAPAFRFWLSTAYRTTTATVNGLDAEIRRAGNIVEIDRIVSIPSTTPTGRR